MGTGIAGRQTGTRMRIRALRAMALAAVMLAGVCPPRAAVADCGNDGVSVAGTPEDVEDACKALDEVVSYFESLGLRPAPEIRILFQDRVSIDMYAPEGPGGTRREPLGSVEVSGFFDAERRELRIASWRSGIPRARRPWGIEWSRPIAYSILQHELVHATLAGLQGARYRELGKAWHEMIAYSVQFDLMDPGLRTRIIESHPEARPFPRPESVNPVVYAADPDAFGLRAHLYAEANGGRNFIARILRNEVPFSTSELESFQLCLWDPGDGEAPRGGPPLAGDGAGGVDGVLPPEALITEMTAWIVARTGLAPPAVPTVVPVSREALLAKAFGSAASAGTDATALYDRAERTIYLDEDWTPSDPRQRSALLHELVHHVQECNDTDCRCIAERERLAYGLQIDWLREQGVEDPAGLLGIDAFTIAVLSLCPETE